MPRRKQDCPTRIELDDDGEGGATSLAVKEASSPVNQDQDSDPDDDQDDLESSSKNLQPKHENNDVKEDEADDNELDDEEEEERSTSVVSKALVIKPTALDAKSGKRSCRDNNKKKHNNKNRTPPVIVKEQETDDEEDDDDPLPALKMVLEDQLKKKMLLPPSLPIDFSVKNAVVKGKRPSSSSSPSKDKKIKTDSTILPSTFPLDLSVKKGSPVKNNSINSLFNNKNALSNHMASLRDFMPMIPFTSPSAKLSRTESSSSPPNNKSPSASSISAFASLALRMGALVPGTNGSVDGSSNNNSTPSSSTKSKGGNKTFPGPSGLITRTTGNHGRQNPWQTQWINRSSEQTRDVFTCVWCKESFRSLQEMTVHMKESPRCGMAGMQHAAATSMSTSGGGNNNSNNSGGKNSRSLGTGVTSSSTLSAASSSTSSPSPSSSSKEPMSNAVLAKNNVSLPRKLVRGQDVWLGRGAEQTRQILKCMWCAQSFKTLDEMTRHMRVTQHYTNIISQEQIISWRTPEDKLAQAQVNAVLTCKVCDEAFGSLKELSYHMVKNAHYKEHILRSITEGGHGRRRQTRERRKKSLPVRKLLELERMSDVTTSQSKASPSSSSSRDHPSSSQGEGKSKSSDAKNNLKDSLTIKCDDCGARVETKHLINHMKTCKGSSLIEDPKSPSETSSRSSRPDSRALEDEDDEEEENVDKTPSPPPEKKMKLEKKLSTDKKDKIEEGEEDSKSSSVEKGPAASSACLSALQSLIDKSFDLKLPPPPSSKGHLNNIPTPSHHHHDSSKKVNGSRHHSSKGTPSPSKLPLSASISAVEKWMALAKERDIPNSNVWSPSVSSESSSWLCSEEEEEEKGVALKANKPISLNERDTRSPVSSASGTGSRPGSVPRPQTSSPLSNDAPVALTLPSKSKNKRTSKEVKREESKDLPLKNEEEERREEIEALKRSIPSDNPSSPSRPSTSSASLSALEKLIEKSFDSKKKNTPTGFLQRLGIDEEVCPPWQPGLGLGLGAAGLPFGHPFQPWLIPKHGGRSSSSSPSKGTKNGSVSSSPPV